MRDYSQQQPITNGWMTNDRQQTTNNGQQTTDSRRQQTTNDDCTYLRELGYAIQSSGPLKSS